MYQQNKQHQKCKKKQENHIRAASSSFLQVVLEAFHVTIHPIPSIACPESPARSHKPTLQFRVPPRKPTNWGHFWVENPGKEEVTYPMFIYFLPKSEGYLPFSEQPGDVPWGAEPGGQTHPDVEERLPPVDPAAHRPPDQLLSPTPQLENN